MKGRSIAVLAILLIALASTTSFEARQTGIVTEGGCGWLGAVLKIRKQHPDDGMKAIQAAFDGHKSMKIVTVVDEDIDITDPVRVEWAMMTRWQPDRDTLILSDQRGSSLDPSRYDDGNTSKIGYDATIAHGVDRSGFMSVQ